MALCPDPQCPAHSDLDEFGRPRSVELGAGIQGLMGPRGHHLLNRLTDGTLDGHLTRGDLPALKRILETEVTPEVARVRAYLEKLKVLEWAMATVTEPGKTPRA